MNTININLKSLFFFQAACISSLSLCLSTTCQKVRVKGTLYEQSTEHSVSVVRWANICKTFYEIFQVTSTRKYFTRATARQAFKKLQIAPNGMGQTTTQLCPWGGHGKTDRKKANQSSS